jgi:hypothetical protein
MKTKTRLRKVSANAVPKKTETVTSQLLSLKVGEALEVPKHSRTSLMSSVYYHQKKKGRTDLKFRTQKKDSKTLYFIRVS